MGMYDRDYYKEWHKEKERKTNKSLKRPKFVLPDLPVISKQDKPSVHWSLIAIFWAFIIIALTVAFSRFR